MSRVMVAIKIPPQCSHKGTYITKISSPPNNNNNITHMTITETTYTIAPTAPSDSGTDYPIVGAVPIHDEPRQRKESSPVLVARPSSTTTALPSTTATVIHVPPPQTTITSYPPPGVADGGMWGTIKHSGGGTWTLCAAISIVGCMVMLFPCGIFAFCCPCDEKDAYLVNQKIYDHNGRYLGKVNHFDFRRR